MGQIWHNHSMFSLDFLVKPCVRALEARIACQTRLVIDTHLTDPLLTFHTTITRNICYRSVRSNGIRYRETNFASLALYDVPVMELNAMSSFPRNFTAELASYADLQGDMAQYSLYYTYLAIIILVFASAQVISRKRLVGCVSNHRAQFQFLGQ